MSSLPTSTNAIEAITTTPAYRELIDRLAGRIHESQVRAARAVNTELVMLYWAIGQDILVQQEIHGWGDNVVGRISEDLRAETGGARGFSRRNLFYMRRFASVWRESEKVQPLAALIGWTHHQVLLDAFGAQRDIYMWYAAKIAEHRWSKRFLKAQIHLSLHEREGAALTNFAQVLEPGDAENTLAVTKDPYVLDFLNAADGIKERQLEKAILDDIQLFLLELGHGFALCGQQTSLLVGGEEFFIDLLFYHHRLRRFVVIDLKIGDFKAEHVGKMNFYLNVVDQQLRHADDRESVGIILCAGRNKIVGALALDRVISPIAVSTWKAGTPDAPNAGDQAELAQLDEVRARLEDRVARHTR